ncbi:hypothetical protein DM02DRAFT_530950 [Periconia macrospinosa]|uniref:Uncharacterized protein n=1 Tax=Periconia macrospinosa TaxID=97972 RepID=A0A2V1DKU8_9PLEO|nr:hypothetical protein DM02DRAFT_530950 [Periconia macrospinosa]
MGSIIRELKDLKDDFRLSTWLLIGGAIQAGLVLVLPPRVAIAPAFFILLYRLLNFAMVRQGKLPNPYTRDVITGKQSIRIPRSDGGVPEKMGDQQVVVFILGARSSHPNGRFAPGYAKLGVAFVSLWKDAEKHREEYGYLGKTPMMMTTEESCNNTMVWISYWKSVDHLYKFANAPIHREIWAKYNEILKTHTHMGLSHELYIAPEKHWEAIYSNYRPFGLGT